MSFQYVKDHPIRHTYPFGSNDVVLPYSGANALSERIREVFDTDAKCRRVIVPVEPDNVEEISACENAGMRYVLEVQLRTGEEHVLMVAEPDWVADQSTDTTSLELT